MSGLLSTADEAKARRRYLVRRGVLLGRPLVGPLEAVVIPTYHCHYRCVFCALESEAPGKKPDMPTATLHRLIDDLAALDAEQVSYTGGGEPLLFPGIDDLVAHTREKGLAASICTNGERLTPERLERFARLGVHLSISLNAATPDLYAKIHPRTKPATFERIVEGLAEYVRLARRGGGDGSFVSLNFVLMNLNFHEIGAMADLGRRIGASQI
jgi:MoaA/NifB/PqqE/SkfB family radical SAM enzyme